MLREILEGKFTKNFKYKGYSVSITAMIGDNKFHKFKVNINMEWLGNYKTMEASEEKAKAYIDKI